MCRVFAIAAGLWLAAVAGVRAETGRKPNAELPTSTAVPGGPTIEVVQGAAPGCPSPCAPLCEPPCGPPGRVWFSAEFLYWHARGYDTPPLITTSPPGTPQTSAGVLGVPGTLVVFGGDRLNDDFFTGLRFGAGFWLNDCRTVGLEGSFFFLFGDNEGTQVSSPGTPILSRPFFNAVTGQPDAELIAFPGLVSGSVGVDSSFAFEGAEANLRCNLCCRDTPCGDCGPSTGWRLDALVGYRYLRLHEDLEIAENLTVTGGGTGLTPGTRFVVSDGFRTENRFHGGQAGLSGQLRRGGLSLDVTGKLGVGSTHQVVSVGGQTVVTTPGAAPVRQPGGLLALPSNSGRFVSDEFTLIPELGVRLGYQVAGGLRVFVGYDLIYWPEVVRPGGQIDLTINPTQIPPGTLAGVARPAPTGRETDLLLQGVSAGIEFRW
jgi:hypothetical protein